MNLMRFVVLIYHIGIIFNAYTWWKYANQHPQDGGRIGNPANDRCYCYVYIPSACSHPISSTCKGSQLRVPSDFYVAMLFSVAILGIMIWRGLAIKRYKWAYYIKICRFERGEWWGITSVTVLQWIVWPTKS